MKAQPKYYKQRIPDSLSKEREINIYYAIGDNGLEGLIFSKSNGSTKEITYVTDVKNQKAVEEEIPVYLTSIEGLTNYKININFPASKRLLKRIEEEVGPVKVISEGGEGSTTELKIKYKTKNTENYIELGGEKENEEWTEEIIEPSKRRLPVGWELKGKYLIPIL